MTGGSTRKVSKRKHVLPKVWAILCALQPLSTGSDALAKPKIDLKSPLVDSLTKAYGEWMTEAVGLVSGLDNAVRPIYALDERTQGLTQVGSGVLFSFGGQTFCCSASHVFDDVGTYQLAIGCGDRIHFLAGDRFSTKPGPSGTHRDDPIDASVVHMTGDIDGEVRARALSLKDLDIGTPPQALERYVISGYRASDSRSTPLGHATELSRFPTIEADMDHYRHLKRGREMHLLLAFEDHVAVAGTWQVAPSINGMSGGAIFRVSDAVRNQSYGSAGLRVWLAATLIERRQKLGRDLVSVAVGTRMGVHFGLINKYLPELHLEEALVEEQHRRACVPMA